MEPIAPKKQQNIIFPIMLALTILTGAFWLIGLNIDIYENAFVGAVFEILWLPVILSCLFVPIACLVLWIMNKLSLKSKYLYLMLISITITYLVVTTGSN